MSFVLLLLFLVLYFWISIGFWTATFGFVWSLRQEKPLRAGDGRQRPGDGSPLPPTAIVMPIYNEDSRRVFANLRAIRESLQATGRAASFDIFVLSDTRDPDLWAEEEFQWARMRAAAPFRAGEGKDVAFRSAKERDFRGAKGDNATVGDSPVLGGVFYRRRTENTDRKSGNIQDFCQRWGSRYRYMVILDADSLMTGETLVEMVRRMEEDPDVGILQVPPVLVNCDSFFARLLQFSTGLYGNVFRPGFSRWAGSEGNYWGHNAVLRVEPFMRHCGLPHLPGSPPWGGEILSHDFVEAALMLRAGWKVVVASDLVGSYEECPGNLIDFAKRDERWSVGNLQNVPLVIAGGIHPVSRFHMGVGALSYVASPLWALFMLLSAVQGIGWQIAGDSTPADARAGLPTAVALAPLVGALALLLLVKVWALVAALCRRPWVRASERRASSPSVCCWKP